MKLSFRQGLVKAQSNFLQVTPSGVNLLTTNSEFIATVSHSSSEYLIKILQSINNAWSGTFSVDTWLYIDIDQKTAARSFGTTSLEPIFSTTQPSSPVNDQHWFDKSNTKMKVFNSTSYSWQTVIRVFVGKLTTGSIATYPYGVGVSQADLVGSSYSGQIVFDYALNPVFKTNKEFFTSEDQLLVDGFAQYVRLESNIFVAQAEENIPSFYVVKYTSTGGIALANYSDIGDHVLALSLDALLFGDIGTLTIQGSVTNPNWTNSGWNINDSLWVKDAGQLVNVDPYESEPNVYPVKHVPVARVLSKDTIIFEQGLGGVGPTGASSTPATVDPATNTTFGTVKLTSGLSSTVVVSDDDSRLIPGNTFASVSHVHTAGNISSTPTGFIAANNVQSALNVISTSVVEKTGSTMSGNLNLGGNKITDLATPTTSTDGVNKAYVDSKINGLNWKDPIHVVNLISDLQMTPPGSPSYSDSYIVPSGASGAWGFPVGTIVHWNGSAWIAEVDGLISAHAVGTRFGISIESPTSAAGSFSGKDNQIAVLVNPALPSWSFVTPTLNDAVYVNNVDSMHAYHQYVFNGTLWIEFGGPQAYQFGGNLQITGNVVNVKQWSAGGTVDAATLEGNSASAFSLTTHNHDGTYVKNSGDTMTGNLIISPSASSMVVGNSFGVSVPHSIYSSLTLGDSTNICGSHGYPENYIIVNAELTDNYEFKTIQSNNHSTFEYIFDSGWILNISKLPHNSGDVVQWSEFWSPIETFVTVDNFNNSHVSINYRTSGFNINNWETNEYALVSIENSRQVYSSQPNFPLPILPYKASLSLTYPPHTGLPDANYTHGPDIIWSGGENKFGKWRQYHNVYEKTWLLSYNASFNVDSNTWGGRDSGNTSANGASYMMFDMAEGSSLTNCFEIALAPTTAPGFLPGNVGTAIDWNAATRLTAYDGGGLRLESGIHQAQIWLGSNLAFGNGVKYKMLVDNNKAMRFMTTPGAFSTIVDEVTNPSLGYSDVLTLLNNTKVGIANVNPQEQLDVNGAIRIGNTATSNSGTIKWNGSTLQAYTGSNWVDLHQYDIMGYIEGTMQNNSTVMMVLPIHSFIMSTNYGTPRCQATVAATGSTTLTINKNGSSIGTMVFAASGTIATVTLTTTTFTTSDVLTVTGPAVADATLANIAFTLPAILA